ncbi:FUSC family protein [Plantactinospora sp. B5E13]|uniref:FUSC family protein n=1 Tax=Plantactinospora sp. B5E13 TaxID=3153758 RepID=UPI00325E7A27
MRTVRDTVAKAPVDLDLDRERISQLAKEFRRRSRATVKDRWHAVRFNLLLSVQASVAAALAWTASHELLGNPSPVFAPISAIGTIASSVGQRFRRTVELIIGVAVGIGLGDLLVLLAGRGAWQLGLIVLLSIVVTIFLGGGPAVVTQAAATAVLIVTVMPSMSNVEAPRVIDALIGGAAGLVVIALVLPLNPLRVVDRAARPALGRLTEELTETAEALRTRDAPRAQRALDRLNEVEEHLQGFEEALEGGRETSILSPVRWHRRPALTQYVESSQFIEHAVHNSGTLIRRAVTVLEDDEPVPEELATAVALLADAVKLLRKDLGIGIEPEAAREQALQAIGQAGRAYDEGVGFSGSVVVAQVRTAGSDVLRATGIERTEANRLVRLAAGGHPDDATQAAQKAAREGQTTRSGGQRRRRAI